MITRLSAVDAAELVSPQEDFGVDWKELGKERNVLRVRLNDLKPPVG